MLARSSEYDPPIYANFDAGPTCAIAYGCADLFVISAKAEIQSLNLRASLKIVIVRSVAT